MSCYYIKRCEIFRRLNFIKNLQALDQDYDIFLDLEIYRDMATNTIYVQSETQLSGTSIIHTPI